MIYFHENATFGLHAQMVKMLLRFQLTS